MSGGARRVRVSVQGPGGGRGRCGTETVSRQVTDCPCLDSWERGLPDCIFLLRWWWLGPPRSAQGALPVWARTLGPTHAGVRSCLRGQVPGELSPGRLGRAGKLVTLGPGQEAVTQACGVSLKSEGRLGRGARDPWWGSRE